jgi:tripartite ATP-independent transporter DctM subunit
VKPEIIGVIGIIALLVLLYGRMWVGFSMLFVGFWCIVAIMGWDRALPVLAAIPYRNVCNYTLAAIPLFILMGGVLEHSGVANDLFYSAYKWLGQLRGGLAMATSVASAVLGVVTDSLVVAIILGKVAVPEMKKYSYDEALAAASVVAGASTASLIPPSIAFLLYALLTNESVGKLFIGAVIPGILLTLVIVVIIGAYARIRPKMAPAGPKTTFREKIASLKYTWGVMVIILMIVGGIYAGIFTPTEAAAIGAAGSMLVALIARRLTRRNLLNAILETAKTTAMIVLMVSGAFVFATMVTVSNLNFMLGEYIAGLTASKYLVLVVVLIMYIVIGMFCDIITGIILTIPIVYPVILSLGFDSVWFGIILVIIMEIGFITPPVGMNVFTFSGVTGIPVGTIFRGVWPFVLAELICIVILTIFPQIVLFLPSTM